ncbi:MAG: PorT family protein [Bacteroidales bacterium]|nr:PorT family protein [Bacteroidales bacterium]
MFDDNHTGRFEDLMKSVLSDAQEEVPAHLWSGISERLDRIGFEKKRRPVIPMFRHTATAIAAAAAVAVGIFFSLDRSTDLVPDEDGSGLIAVIQDTISDRTYGSIAEAKIPKPQEFDIFDRLPDTHVIEATEDDEPTVAAEPEITVRPERKTEQERTESAEQPMQAEEVIEYFPEVWPEDEVNVTKRRKASTSVMISGIVGTNNVEAPTTIGPIRRPAISKTPIKTGITEKSSNSIYGLPISFGVGVKIGIAPRWSVGTGVNYTLLTRKFFGTYTLVKENSTEQTSSDIRNTQQYIGIPVNVFYNIMDRQNINFYAYAGGAIEKGISDKYRLLETPITHTEKIEGLQFSANVGIGVEFLFGKHLGLYIDPRLSYYFKNSQPKSIRTDQPLIMEFEMGLRWRFARGY